ncbi:MAG: BrnA antitoxin family protein [Deltaproteobacteria bacterium]|nr:BrnA antitoxin family protein [Deltaproteobacteria bacterium]
MREGIKGAGGRPRAANPKKSTTVRLDAEVLDFFKAQGKGWQTKMNNVLRDYVAANG